MWGINSCSSYCGHRFSASCACHVVPSACCPDDDHLELCKERMHDGPATSRLDYVVWNPGITIERADALHGQGGVAIAMQYVQVTVSGHHDGNCMTLYDELGSSARLEGRRISENRSAYAAE
jgi:hypothetical protein